MKSFALHNSVIRNSIIPSDCRLKMEISILSQRDKPNTKYVSLNYVSPRRLLVIYVINY